MEGIYTCDDHRKAVVIYPRNDNCPLCAALERITELEEERDQFVKQVDDLKDEVETLTKDLEAKDGA